MLWREGHCLQSLVVGGLPPVSLVTMAVRFSEVVRVLVAASLRLMDVVACWVVHASRKYWVLSRSTVRLDRLVLTLLDMVAVRATADDLVEI